MARQIHFEVFRRAGARGGWTLHEVVSEREGGMSDGFTFGKGLVAIESEIGAHMEAVLKTRTAVQHAWRLLEPSEQAGLPPPADLVSGRKSRRKAE